jgi:hypothetical protein
MKKIFLFFYLFVCLSKINAQECGFEEPKNYETYESKKGDLSSSSTPNYCINLAFRILRDNDGTNAAFNPSDIPQALAILNQAFAPHSISFVQVGTFDYINNTNFNHYSPNTILPSQIPNAINIYFIKDFGTLDIGGVGNNTHVYIKGSLGLAVDKIAHEVGHCLNLLHTHECSFKSVNASCAENPDGSNSSYAGDKVVDTPADAYKSGQNYYTSAGMATYPSPPYPLSSYHPDLTNIMSYWWEYNPDHFTLGQGQRMRDAILNAPYLQSVRSNQCAVINGPNYICSTGANTFSVAAFGSPLDITWSVSNNLYIIGSNSGSSITVKSSAPDNTGTATISVTINGIVKTKTITIGAPVIYANNQVIGLYDWVSTGYGNMGMIAPTNSSIVSFRWTIDEDPDFGPNCPTSTSTKARFINSPDAYEYVSNTNQAIVNWGSCTGSYLLTCYAVNECGETVYQYKYVDVGNPKNNPCYKNSTHVIVAPNPIREGRINILVNKTPQQTPCKWKDNYVFQEFNRKLDKTQNEVTIYDYNGTKVYSQIYDTDEFVIERLELNPANYIINNITNEGVISQEVIIIE